MPKLDISETLVLVSQQNGLVIIPSSTPMTSLNLFDGKFLRAADLKIEQEYLRQLVAQSNQANGSGVARGFDLTIGAGDTLNLGAGLAIDPAGRVLLLPQGVSLDTQDLIDRSRELQAGLARTAIEGGGFAACQTTSTTRPTNLIPASDVYLIVLSHAEALCGEEDVFGKLCEEACVTSTDRPFLIEGVIVLAIPLVLVTPLPNSAAIPLTGTHFRSRVASAYFEDERRVIASLISRAGLALQTWCLGANPAAGSGVPIGVIARAGATTVFLDAWTARRELIETGARRYWQWRMMMRPWDVFLAQILQFQCQLRDLFRSTPAPNGDVDPCGGALGAVNEAATAVTELTQFYQAATQRFTELSVDIDDAITFTGGSTRLASLGARLAGVSHALATAPRDSVLINGGIVELPSAGYLPVVPGVGATVNQQVHQLMGDGVELRYCVVRPDYVAHALEEAQHMERISLVHGLDHPDDKPKVDILVPDGAILEIARPGLRNGFETRLTLLSLLSGILEPSPVSREVTRPPIIFNGVTHLTVLPSGGGAIYSAGFSPREIIFAQFPVDQTADETARAVPRQSFSLLPNLGPAYGYWLSVNSEKNVFAMSQNEVSSVNGRAIFAERRSSGSVFADVRLVGEFRVTAPGASAVNGQLSLTGIATLKTGTTPTTQTKALSLAARVVLSSPIAGGSRVDVTVQGTHGEEVFFNAIWGKDPITASAGITTGSLTSRATSATTPAATSELHPNPDVFQVTNARHGQAISGLQVVGSALADSGLVDSASSLLFPPVPAASEELIIRATRDWVLFHRRRNKQCSVEVKAPPFAPPRQYRVHHLNLIDDGNTLNIQLEGVKAFLKGGGDFSPFFVPVTDVEFQGGVAALISDPASIRTDWAARNPGNKLIYGAIASTPDAALEGDDLALSRLGQIETVVSSISPFSATLVSELLPAIPRAPVVAGPDGAIVLITSKPLPPPILVCHNVARLAFGVTIDQIASFVQEGVVARIFSLGMAVEVGQVLFREGTASLADGNSLLVPVTELAPFGPPVEALLVSHVPGAGGTLPNISSINLQQAQLILDALEGNPPLIKSMDVASLPPPCPAITFIRFATRCITPPEIEILSVGPVPGGTASPVNATVRITNNFDFDFEIQGLNTTGPFSVTMPANRIVGKNGGFVDVTVRYTRLRFDFLDDQGELTIVESPIVSCPATRLIGRRLFNATDVLDDKPAEQVESKDDVPAAKKKKTNRGPAKPASRRKPKT